MIQTIRKDLKNLLDFKKILNKYKFLIIVGITMMKITYMAMKLI